MTIGNYSHNNPIQFLTNSIDSSYCDYSDAYVLVTGEITVTRLIAATNNNPAQTNQALNAATQVAFKSCTPFKNCRTEINDVLLMRRITFIFQCL